ncbi:MAG: PAS domain S-box protein [Bacteroidales bacterium]|nr:PAS domain S-box protein [Bacteroidales bacterium]
MKQPDYKSIIYHSPLAFVYLEAIYDKKGGIADFRFLEVNSRFKEISGTGGDNIIGKTVNNTLADYIKSSLDMKMYGMLAIKGGSKIHELYFRPTGNWYRVLAYSNEKGFLAVLIEDITESKQAVDKMRASEEKYRSLFESLVVGIYRSTPDGLITEANTALVNILGFPDRETLLKTNVKELYPVQKERIKEFQLLDEKNVILSNEIRLKRYDGTIIWVSDSFRGVRDDKGNLIYFEGTILDITQRKETAEALLKSEERYKNFISQVTDAVYRFEFTEPIPIDMPMDQQVDLIYERSRLAECNPAFCKMYGIEEEDDVLNRSVTDFYGTEDNPQNRYVTEQFIRSGYKVENNITEEFDSKGNRKYINNNTLGIVEDGKLMRIWGTQTDITERKKSENELLIAKQKAEESNRLKTQFLTNMSHEIRTPMNSIIGFMELLQRLDLTNKERENFLATMQESGYRLLDTINNIIEMSKIETGNTKPEFSEIFLAEIIDYLVDLYKPQSDEKGIELMVSNKTGNEPISIISDRNLLTSILSNIMNNALKFTHEGKIELGYFLEDNSVSFVISDSGIGIPDDHREKVFERFVQADSGLSRQYEGSGLGLSIARSYAGMLGGRIWFESREGEGTSFYLSIPFKGKVKRSDSREKVAAKDEEHYETGRKLKILIAEDDDASFMYFETILTRIGAEVSRAVNGYETIQKLKEAPDLDVILMDIKMPVINGWDTSMKIREFNRKIPIIATTAYALTGDKERSFEAGCDFYLAKPVRRDELLTVMSKILER